MNITVHVKMVIGYGMKKTIVGPGNRYNRKVKP
jgi:hypothetical protein